MAALVAVTSSLIVAFCAGWALGALFVAAVYLGSMRRQPPPFRPAAYWG